MCNCCMLQPVDHIGNKYSVVLVSSFILNEVVKNSEVAHIACHTLEETLNPFKPICVPGKCICYVVLTEADMYMFGEKHVFD